jgi:RND family efflux transporter MFP subunit
MKKYAALLLTMLMLVMVTGCSKDEAVTTEQISAVKVQKIQLGEMPVELYYVGTLDAKETIQYSFKSGGQISRVFVEKGDWVKAGDKLMELDTHDLAFQVSAAQTSMETARLNLAKTKDSLTYTRSNMDRMNTLYAENVLSKDQYEQLKLQADLAETTLAQASSQYNAAVTSYEYQLSLEQDATIYAQKDGVVVDLLSRENERVSPLAPVISVRSVEEVVNIGIPQQDLKNIQVGSNAKVDIDGQKAEGTITNLAEAPDQATRTYKAEVTVQSKDFRIGSIAKVAIDTGKETGIWIPITSVLSDGGEDYVYTVKDERAFKRTIEILKQLENNIMVRGLESGELVAISGMKNLDDGARVKTVE